MSMLRSRKSRVMTGLAATGLASAALIGGAVSSAQAAGYETVPYVGSPTNAAEIPFPDSAKCNSYGAYLNQGQGSNEVRSVSGVVFNPVGKPWSCTGDGGRYLQFWV